MFLQESVIQWDVLRAALAFQATARARQIHQNPSHEPRGYRVEVNSIPPRNVPYVEQPDVCLVDQFRGIQPPGPFTGGVAAGQTPQLRVDQRSQLLQRLFVTRAPGAKQTSDVVCGSLQHSRSRLQ